MSQNAKTDNRFYYLDILRIVFSLLIIGGHVSAYNWDDAAVTSSEWQIINIYNCISHFGIPLFFMMSGALFLHETSDLNLKKLYGKKILRLVISYHFWLLFFNLLPFFREQIEWTAYNLKYGLLNDILLGKGVYHLWFIPEIIVLYMLSPILKEAFRKKEICRYFLILYAIIGTLLPMLLTYDFPYKKYVLSYYHSSSLTMLTEYVGYFVLGHYIHSFGIDISKRWKRILFWCLALVGAAVKIVACSIDALATGQPSSILNTPFTLASFVCCLAVFALSKYYLRNITLSQKGLWHQLSLLTFGIYLFHPYILQLFEPLNIDTLSPHPVIMIPLLVFLVFIASAIPIWLIRKIPILGKWIV